MCTELERVVAELSRIAPKARVEQEEFSSGAVWLDIMIDDRWFVLSTGPVSGIGVSENHDGDNTAFCRHDRYFQTLDEAAGHLLTLVGRAVDSSNRQAA